MTLKDSGWVLSLSVFHQPEIIGQPPGTSVWWGYGLYPERNGNFVRKRMDQCSGAEILEETLRHLQFDRHLKEIISASIACPATCPTSTISGSPGAAATGLPRFQRGRSISDSSASTSRFPGK